MIKFGLKTLVLFFSFIILASCKRNNLVHLNHSDIEFNSQGDTVTVVRHYLTGEIKEEIMFENNRIKSNAVYDKKKTSRDRPVLLLDSGRNSIIQLALIIPYDTTMQTDLFFGSGSDSITFAVDSIVNITRSADFPLQPQYIHNGSISGVIRQRSKLLSSRGNVFYPFRF